MSKPSVQAAQFNLEANAVDNVTMVRMASHEISDALAGGREYRRMRASIWSPTGSRPCSSIRPERASAGTVALARGSVSHSVHLLQPPDAAGKRCPTTPIEIAAAAAFDQFPHHTTPRVRSAVAKRRAARNQEPSSLPKCPQCSSEFTYEDGDNLRLP